MVTGPDGNLYIAMDDEYEVSLLTVPGPCIAQVCRACAGRMHLHLCATSMCIPDGLRNLRPDVQKSQDEPWPTAPRILESKNDA